ncbi:inositol monophosphatase family protein [Protaetiibacter mangrovi]|uniref:Inositol-1-monophosphatase n=1 Tax=Protaetiibacter mangrovi TaxID=2970926 RepID=A0ABT1ZG62_9MICO|nr:inositol monophosphatase family protein [Protaetiibacter mangrovi]MCS0499704.1 inositol monophosphatase [Protaetiibacter mangrovi]TPX04821.1 inositol monophosphatase [Schumannella luteola]
MTSELLDLARTIAVEAGGLAARRRAEGVEVAATKSSIVDVVTAADREVEEFIRARIAAARPQDGILGEEGGATGGTSGVTWVVDPIDGTVNYLYGIPHYAVSIAVVEGDPEPLTWTALAGAVVNPAIGEVFTAARGVGAFLGDQRIRIADAVPLEQALIATGFAYDAAMRGRQGEVVAKLLPSVRDIRRQGTASLDLASVANGRLNAYFERTLNPWDHGAGALIAEEAGALVKGLGAVGRPSREFLIAGHPDVVGPLEELLVELGV